MQKSLLIYVIIILCSTALFSQKKQRLRDKIIYTSAVFSVYPSLEPYRYLDSYETTFRDLDLTFLTRNSGTFVVEGTPLTVEAVKTIIAPSQVLNIGTSIQVIDAKNFFQEVSLTKLSFTKSLYTDEYKYIDSTGTQQQREFGYRQNSGVVALRYEFGKFFGKNKKAKVKFGLSGGLETSLYTYNRRPVSFAPYSVKATVLTIELALIPVLSFQLSRKMALDFKVIPNFLISDYGGIRWNNPNWTSRQQLGVRAYDLPEINLIGSILVKYKINEPKKKKRRK